MLSKCYISFVNNNKKSLCIKPFLNPVSFLATKFSILKNNITFSGAFFVVLSERYDTNKVLNEQVPVHHGGFHSSPVCSVGFCAIKKGNEVIERR